MDSLMEMTRELAYELQNDERFIRTQMTQAAADDDAELQGLIGEFNLKRAALNSEMAKDNKDSDKLKTLDVEIRDVYTRMMGNERMLAYQSAKTDLDKLVRGMLNVITMAAQGEDPDTVEEQSGCGGSCSGCSGCH